MDQTINAVYANNACCFFFALFYHVSNTGEDGVNKQYKKLLKLYLN